MRERALVSEMSAGRSSSGSARGPTCEERSSKSTARWIGALALAGTLLSTTGALAEPRAAEPAPAGAPSAASEPVSPEAQPAAPASEPVSAEPQASAESESASPEHAASPSPEREAPKSGFGNETLFGRPLEREGFHFHVSFGVGSGPSIAGLYHAMEIGWSFSGYTIALLHTFIQYKDVFGPSGTGPDEIGGFKAQVTGPLYFRDLTWKFAAGVGGTVDQPEGEFNANPGFGVHYGVDLHFPIWPKFGPTLSVAAMNVVERGNHHFGAGLALGVTVF